MVLDYLKIEKFSFCSQTKANSQRLMVSCSSSAYLAMPVRTNSKHYVVSMEAIWKKISIFLFNVEFSFNKLCYVIPQYYESQKHWVHSIYFHHNSKFTKNNQIKCSYQHFAYKVSMHEILKLTHKISESPFFHSPTPHPERFCSQAVKLVTLTTTHQPKNVLQM